MPQNTLAPAIARVIGVTLIVAAVMAVFRTTLPYDWSWVGCGDESNSVALAASWIRTGVPTYGVSPLGEPYSLNFTISPIYYLAYGLVSLPVPPEQILDATRLLSAAFVGAGLVWIGVLALGPADKPVATAFSWASAALLILVLANTLPFTVSAHFGRLDALGVLACAALGAALGRAWRTLESKDIWLVLIALGLTLFVNLFTFTIGAAGCFMALLIRMRGAALLRWLAAAAGALTLAVALFVLTGLLFFGAAFIPGPPMKFHAPDFSLHGPRIAQWMWPLIALGLVAALCFVLKRRDLALRIAFIIAWMSVVFLPSVYRFAYDAMLISMALSFWLASSTDAAPSRALQNVAIAALVFVLFHNAAIGQRIFPSHGFPFSTAPWLTSGLEGQSEANAELRASHAALIETLEGYPHGAVISIEPQHSLLAAAGANVLFFNPNAAREVPADDWYAGLLPQLPLKYVLINTWFCRMGGPLCDMHAEAIADPAATPTRTVGPYTVTLERRITLNSADPQRDYPYCGGGMYPMSLFRVTRAAP